MSAGASQPGKWEGYRRSSVGGAVLSDQQKAGATLQNLTLKLTVDELRLVATLASEQLFRREFIDRRIPGFKPNPAEVGVGKALVARFRLLIGQATTSPKEQRELPVSA